MKAERRHELKENDLLHYMGTAREYLDQNGKSLMIGVLVIGAIAAGLTLNARAKSAAREDVWRRKSALQFTDVEVGRESLAALAAMTDGAPEDFVFDSLVSQGFEALRLAQLVPVPPDEDLNKSARRAFEQLLKDFSRNPLAVGLAHCGLATVEENAFVLDEDMAHKERVEAHLSAIVDDASLSGLPFQRIAMDRRRNLDAVFTKVRFEYPPAPPEPAPAPKVEVVPGVAPTDTADDAKPAGADDTGTPPPGN